MTTLLLLCDLQPDIFGFCAIPNEGKDLVAVANDASAAARSNDVKVGFVRVAFRPGHPEVNETNGLFKTVKEYNKLVDGTDGANLHPGVERKENEPIFTKRRVSAFTTTELAAYCRGQNVKHLVLGGVSTGGVILTTLREAADMDFKLTVLSDLCADGSKPEMHEALLKLVFPNQAEVKTVAEWKEGGCK